MSSSFATITAPDCLLFVQHGWADTNYAISKLAKALSTSKTHVIAPNLGYLRTWLRIEPLIASVEKVALETVKRYPQIPIRIVGHSMGGLIWLEVLERNPQLRARVESLVLIGSPVGGADLARLLDPFGFGIGIARDLGIDRRTIGKRIAGEIPTLIIAGDIDNGSDGTVLVETTKFAGAKFVCTNIAHAILKNHPSLVEIIRDFWANPVLSVVCEPDFTIQLLENLRSLPGMTDAHWRDFPRAKTQIIFSNGVSIRTWNHPFGIPHVFVADSDDNCLYGGFVGWLHVKTLQQFLNTQQELEVKLRF
jgi:pimeloyl-ACP methyl ester carboxylesterase